MNAIGGIGMVKIKINREFNLAGLLEYINKNKITDKYYFNSARNAVVEVTKNGFISFPNTFKPDDTFTVEVQEVVTEETVFPKLISFERYAQNVFNVNFNCSIKQFLDRDEHNYYYLNDDGTMTLIWKDGKLID